MVVCKEEEGAKDTGDYIELMYAIETHGLVMNVSYTKLIVLNAADIEVIFPAARLVRRVMHGIEYGQMLLDNNVLREVVKITGDQVECVELLLGGQDMSVKKFIIHYAMANYLSADFGH